MGFQISKELGRFPQVAKEDAAWLENHLKSELQMPFHLSILYIVILLKSERRTLANLSGALDLLALNRVTATAVLLSAK